MARSTSGEVAGLSSRRGWVRIPHGSLKYIAGCRGAAPHVPRRFESGHPDYTDSHTARSSNGRGRRSDKAETKVRLLFGLLKRRPSDANSPTTETDTTPIRGRGVTAAQRAFNSHGGGSNPSGLIDLNYRPVAQRSEPAPYKGQTTVRLRPGLLNTQHGIEVLAAAYPALNRVGDGSSPSGPTQN